MHGDGVPILSFLRVKSIHLCIFSEERLLPVCTYKEAEEKKILVNNILDVEGQCIRRAGESKYM